MSFYKVNPDASDDGKAKSADAFVVPNAPKSSKPPEDSPEKYILSPGKLDAVLPTLPKASGDWVSQTDPQAVPPLPPPDLDYPLLYAALVHYPIVDKHGDTVTTSITNLDIHDISRAVRTFELAGYFLVSPIEPQHWLVRRIIGHWSHGWGSTYNPNRMDALSRTRAVFDLNEVAEAIREHCGQDPIWVATSAKPYPNNTTFAQLREALHATPRRAHCLIFGTGHGLHPEVMAEADEILEPINGPGRYNHLSVRSAATIIFDRLLSPK